MLTMENNSNDAGKNGIENKEGILKGYVVNSDPKYTQSFANNAPNEKEAQSKKREILIGIAAAAILIMVCSVVWKVYGPYKCSYCKNWFTGKREPYSVATDYGIKDAFICEECYRYLQDVKDIPTPTNAVN